MDREHIHQKLKDTFGFSQFRPGQEEAIDTILNHGSALCILPTGHGKSLLYQLPTTLLEGMTVVISPLLALMRDQLDHLQRRFGISSASINSDQSEEENGLIRYQAMQGKYKLLFVAPEQLDHVDRFQFLLNLPVSFVVVDEAHCISTWGHDFRPSYRQIIQYVQALSEKNPQVRVLGLTATADSNTEEDVKRQLSAGNREVKVLRQSMDRPNISLSVVPARGLAQKLETCKALLKQLKGCGLIYCATRENSELVGEYLKEHGINAESYHAGFSPEVKRQLQHDFLKDTYQVLCATNALGMGIDKQNLRFIVHFDIPGSITAYYQEIGRCGRDGLPSQAILLFDPADRKIQDHFIRSAQPEAADFHAVMKIVKESQQAPNLTRIRIESGLHPTRITVVVAELVEQGFLQKRSQGGLQVYQLTEKPGAPHLERYQRQLEIRTRELNCMIQYAEQREACRMSLLRKALGDQQPPPCGHCDACQKGSIFVQQPSAESCKYTESWIAKRPIPIKGYKSLGLLDGFAILEGKQRTPLFKHFMFQRAKCTTIEEGIPNELMILLTERLQQIHQKYGVASIIPIPSRTWGIRDSLVSHLCQQIQVPALLDLLRWQEVPRHRQGELTNNDQRRDNVQKKMSYHMRHAFGPGAIVLFDDYSGSGATLKEAARVLRRELGCRNDIIPFTVAAIRWRLGSSGMI